MIRLLKKMRNGHPIQVGHKESHCGSLSLGLLAPIICLISGFLTLNAASRERTPQPNVILIVVDDLGIGDLGCYGQRHFQTPRLDQMAQEGVRFTHYYSGSPVGAASRAVLMTGRHSGHATIRGNQKVPLEYGDYTLAEGLKQLSYASCAIGLWSMGQPGSTGLPNLQGFDEWFGFLDQEAARNHYPEFLWRNQQVIRFEANGNNRRGLYIPYKFTDAAMNFIQSTGSSPFFLYLSYTLPAGDLMVPTTKPYSDMDWPEEQKMKAAMIYRLDRDVGKILDLLDEKDLSSSTLVLFCSDNGPPREGVVDPDFFKSSGELRGGSEELYEGGIRSPMIMRWKGQLNSGKVSDQVFAAWDLMPTILELCGENLPGGLDGVSLKQTLLKGDLVKHPPMYWETHEEGFRQAIRFERWKAIRFGMGEGVELYDLEKDPSEQTDLSLSHPDLVAELTQLMDVSHTSSSAWPVSP